MNKYLSVIAGSTREESIVTSSCGCSDESHEHIKQNDILSRVVKLQDDPVYDINVPNLVRSLIGVFARNYLHFHDKSGRGYNFVADKIICLNAINPQIAAGLAGAFKLYPKMNAHSASQMKKELHRILNTPDLSKNVYEIVEKILDIKE
jgi:aminopeptidase N